ncbi:MAG: adenylyltransferase/cytidyltransferase family protein [Flavobacteriales bacterium]
MSRLAFIESKIITLHQAAQCAEKKRLKNQKVVFTNGCFDILHRGHVTYLAEAASLGDVLFVAVNDDASVRSLGKGGDRPVNPELARALVLASLGFVDFVVIFSEPTPLTAIQTIKPDWIVKGGDYNAELSDTQNPRYIVGSNEAKAWGGRSITIPLVEGYSTSAILAKRG